MYDLDKTLLQFVAAENEPTWTIRNAVEGVQIFGGIGSGKTSGSGRLLALKYLVNGFGGLVLTTKHDEKQLWQEYCRLTGRSNDLIIVEPNGKHFFNFLEYESSRNDEKSYTANIVQVLKTVIRAGEEKNSGRMDDSFWESALDMLMFNCIDLCLIAYGKVTIDEVYKIAQTANLPQNKASAFSKAYKEADRKTQTKINEWQNRAGKEHLQSLSEAEYVELLYENVPDARLLLMVDDFFMLNYRPLSEKTRSIIDFSFTGFLFHLLKDPIYSLFCKNPSTFTPESCINGKIILLNLPVKIYNKVGRDVQIMFKYIWQRAMEKRNVALNGRPVFLWADEAQNFLHEHDANYQATARSSLIATVYISQNMPNYYACMGGANGDAKVKSFLGTLSTKIFHANADVDTNTYASDIIGHGWQEETQESRTSSSGNISITEAVSTKLQKIVRPEEISLLKTGGPINKHRVGGYIHVQGKKFSNGFNHTYMVFNQHRTP